MIHEDGVSPEEAQAYVQRWALRPPEEAAHSVRFVTDPTWRAYVITYSAGRELCHAWVGGDPARFVRLLHGARTQVRDLLSTDTVDRRARDRALSSTASPSREPRPAS